MPAMGWYIKFRQEDEDRIVGIVRNSSFAYCLEEPEDESFAGEEDYESDQETNHADKKRLSGKGVRNLLMFLLGLLVIVSCLFIVSW